MAHDPNDPSVGDPSRGDPNPVRGAPKRRDPDDRGGDSSRRGAVIGLVITALLVVAGYYLMTSLREQGKLEDCLMAGRRNCAPIDTSHK